MSNSVKQNIFLLLIFAAIFFIARKIWFMDFPITNFDNLTFGMATAKNIDISKAMLWYFIYAVPLCFLFAYLLNKSSLRDKAKDFLDKIKINQSEENAFLMLIVFAFLILGVHNPMSITCAVCFGLILIFAREKEKVLVALISTIYIFSPLIFYLGIYFNDAEKIFIGFSIFITVCLLCIKNFQTTFAKLFPFLIAGIVAAVLLNLLEISLVRGFTISDKILIAPYIIAGLSFIFFKPDENKSYDKKILRGTLISMIFTFTPGFGNGGYVDFFEGANHGLTIQDFITGQGMPLIDNLDAHMLSLSLGGIIYFLLTGDNVGALFAPYASIIFMLIGLPSFFYLLKKFLPEKQAFIILSSFPFSNILTVLPGIISIIAFCFWKNNPNFLRGLAVIVTISFLCLYRIDLGASFGFALFLCPILFCLFNRKKKILLQYILATILWSAIFFVVVFYGLDFKFAEDFLAAFNSNQHWAYGDLGNFSRVFLIYFILPIVISILLLPVVKKIVGQQGNENDWLIIFLWLTFVFGITRMMVRHTFVEFATATYAVEILLFTFLAVNLCKRYKATVFVGIFFAFIATCTNANQESILLLLRSEFSAINSVHAQQRSFFVNFTEEDKKQMALMKKFFDENLQADETYFDFTNQTLFFAVTGRKNPIYINQCPAMINGVKGQLQALESLKKSKIIFITFPYLQRKNLSYGCYGSCDGILNCDRYYLLTEWIAKNYQPYEQIGDFFVWQEKNSASPESLNYNYELPENHFHALGYIPFLQGQSSIQSEDTKISPQDLKNFTGKVGFLALEISADNDFDAYIRLKGEGINEIVYQFKIKKGTHLYRFRISSDILWYSGKVETLDTENLQVEQIIFQEVKE